MKSVAAEAEVKRLKTVIKAERLKAAILAKLKPTTFADADSVYLYCYGGVVSVSVIAKGEKAKKIALRLRRRVRELTKKLLPVEKSFSDTYTVRGLDKVSITVQG